MFEDLYKRAANGAVRHWTIEVDGATMCRTSGQLGGTYTEKFDNYVDGKNIGRSNETTPEEQCKLEAESYWKKQLDNGYKTLEMLGIDKTLTGRYLHNELYDKLPKYNTDAQGNIKPMLAKAVDWKIVPFPVYIQPKFDGVRCLMTVNPDGEVMYLSRSGKPYTTLEHITRSIQCFPEQNPIIVDGEIYAHDFTFQEIISAVKKQSAKSLQLKFRAYDLVNDKPQNARLHDLMHLVMAFDTDDIVMTDEKVVCNKAEAMEFHNDAVLNGYEGAMIRPMLGKYQQGVRSGWLRKVKEFDEQEFRIVGGKIDKVLILSGPRFPDDPKMIDSFTFTCVTKDGKVFEAKPMGSREHRLKYMNDLDKLKGNMLTVKFFGWTEDRIPRFPIGKIVRDYE